MSDGWDPNIYPKPRFVSEYGFQSFPSYNNWKRTIKPNESILAVMEHRQHFPEGSIPVINLIRKHLPLPSNETDNETYAKALIYFSQISQAMTMKAESESYR